MNAIVDPNGPTLAVVPSNPVPEGARVGYFTTSDKVKLRYATFPKGCLLYTSPSPRDGLLSRMPSSA